MKKILLTASLLISIQCYSSMMSSALFSTTKEVAHCATQKAWSCDQVKETVCSVIVTTLQPLTNFAYENMTLAAASTVAVALVAYKAGKFIHMPAYKPEDVKQVVVLAQTPSARSPRISRA